MLKVQLMKYYLAIFQFFLLIYSISCFAKTPHWSFDIQNKYSPNKKNEYSNYYQYAVTFGTNLLQNPYDRKIYLFKAEAKSKSELKIHRFVSGIGYFISYTEQTGYPKSKISKDISDTRALSIRQYAHSVNLNIGYQVLPSVTLIADIPFFSFSSTDIDGSDYTDSRNLIMVFGYGKIINMALGGEFIFWHISFAYRLLLNTYPDFTPVEERPDQSDYNETFESIHTISISLHF